ncbi:MAG: GDSL-type esterase/lipase family protein [Pirellula sp.]
MSLFSVAYSVAQDTKSEPDANQQAPSSHPPIAKMTTAEDHRQMMEQLGITKLRPGRNGNPNGPNAANTDEALATPFESLPELLKLRDGSPVSTADAWWNQRRPELLEDFEREVVGRIPANTPAVVWEVIQTESKKIGEIDAIQKQLVGRVDNAACPEIDVNISMVVLTPQHAPGPVPTLMMFGFTGFEPWAAEFRARMNRNGAQPPANAPPSAAQQLLEAGWGVATISPGTIQADNGEGLTRGIIGLTNRGQPRQPEDWGALRAWAWGASRGLDYLQTDTAVDAKRVGIEGVSRFGKAALVCMAMDARFAFGLIGSSGEGGASLYRRNFGEAVENLTSSGEYHWMAGNFLKYGTEASTFGSRTANDLPVDAHGLIALCAPRPIFISYGIPEKGDALWLDQQGSFMAAIAALPIYRLLGADGLQGDGVERTTDWKKETMPAVNVDLLDAPLAWRQHDGGHTDLPNIPHFIRWASKMMRRSQGESFSDMPSPSSDAQSAAQHAMLPREDIGSNIAHQELLQKAQTGRIDVYFVGDSITRRWGATDYPEFLAHWKRRFHGWNAANFGWGGDTTHHILWRLEHGELAQTRPKVFVIQAGANNLPRSGAATERDIEDTVQGIQAIVERCRKQSPDATIVLTAMFPRRQNQELANAIEGINAVLAQWAKTHDVEWINFNAHLVDGQGVLLETMSSDGLHLNLPAYDRWANALEPILTKSLGPRSEVDLAPPPTGDPKARVRSAP